MANFVSNDNATSLMNAINQKKDSKPSTITWAEWIALTDEQREGTHYIITNVPARFSDKDAVFSIKDQTLTFTNKTATVTDSRITADTYIFTFYHNQAVAQAAGIECSWTTGTVTFTVDENPSENIVVDILCILPALATPPSEGGGHTIVGPTGTEMTQEDKLQFTGDVTVTDDSTNGKTVVNITGGGHTIENESGTDLTQRSTLQFAGYLKTTDDSTNSKTVVDNTPINITWNDYNALSTAEREGNHYIITGAPGVDPTADTVSVTADGDKTWATLLNELYALVDLTKIKQNANLCIVDTYHPIVTKTNVLLAFSKTKTISNTQLETSTFVLQSSNSSCNDYTTTTGSPASATLVDKSNNKPSSGAVITLHYGTSSSIINLKTDADNCMMSDGETSVEDVINELNPSALTYTADGEKTYKQCLSSLKVRIDTSKINYRSVILIDGAVHKCIDTSLFRFSRTYATTIGLITDSPFLTGACSYITSVGSTTSDDSDTVPPNGTVFAFYYN